MMDRSMIDAASKGALMDKMPAAMMHLISNMASNTQQFGIRGTAPSRMVNEVSVIDNLRLENQLTELTSLVRQLVIGITTRVCGICTFVEHPIDMFPTLQETESDHPESVGSIGGYQYGKQSYPCRPYERQYPTQKFELAQGVPQEIPGTTIPIAATIKSAITRKLTISSGLDEVVGDKQPRVSA
ncbi:hypothetical protein CR513_28892, partial [Mucuna pruriens]